MPSVRHLFNCWRSTKPTVLANGVTTFDPDYAKLGKFREWLGGVQTVALTATATPRVREDIVHVLGLSDQAVHEWICSAQFALWCRD